MKRYARGDHTWGECQRCGLRYRNNDLMADGYTKNLRVCEACYDPEHPQEKIVPVSDAVAVRHPAPQISKPTGEGTAAPALTFDAQGNLA